MPQPGAHSHKAPSDRPRTRGCRPTRTWEQPDKDTRIFRVCEHWVRGSLQDEETPAEGWLGPVIVQFAGP